MLRLGAQAVVALVVSHCCICTASKDHIGLSGDRQVNQKRIWTSGIGVKQAVFYETKTP